MLNTLNIDSTNTNTNTNFNTNPNLNINFTEINNSLQTSGDFFKSSELTPRNYNHNHNKNHNNPNYNNQHNLNITHDTTPRNQFQYNLPKVKSTKYILSTKHNSLKLNTSKNSTDKSDNDPKM